MNLTNKKLLVLGGTSYYPYIRKYADQKGFCIYSAGKSSDEITRTYVDRFFQVDAVDVDAISALVKEEGVDGIVALGNEDIINAVIDISANCGLPFYIERKHWDDLQDKQNFKKHCKEFGIDVVEEYPISRNSDEDSLKALPYPVVLKPTDGCGSRGVTVCYDHHGIKKAMEKAQKFSRSNQFIAERYMACPEFIATYIIDRGKSHLWMLGDRHMNATQQGFGGISQISVFSSRYSKLYIDSVHPKMLKLLEKYGPENGTFFAQGFVDGDRIRFFDPGLRFCGTLDIIPYEKILGINPVHWMINHSLTGIMDDTDEVSKMDVGLKGKVSAQLSLHLCAGTIDKISGIAELCKIENVISAVQLLHEGSCVDMIGTLQQVLVRVYLITDSQDELDETISKIYEKVSVTDKEGNEMLMPFVWDYDV